MNLYINYLIEANLGLVAFLIFYVLMLRNETNFTFKRWFLLAGVAASLLFPLIKFPLAGNSLPSIDRVVEPYLLPEVVIIGSGKAAETFGSPLTVVAAIKWLYLSVAGLLLLAFGLKFSRVVKYIRSSVVTYRQGKFNIIESVNPLPTFSFFHHIFIGNASIFSAEEKKDIIAHEITHATKFHSLDMLLVEFLNIFFWFNPAVYYYKRILNNIHEFQVDELVTQHTDVNQYCSLLAKVALLSADFPLASHFNNSLTLKRIAMMNTLKTKISTWKIAILASWVSGLFLFVACQDQVVSDLVKNNMTMTQTSDFPPKVVEDIRLYKEKHLEQSDDGSFTYITGDIEEVKKLAANSYAGQSIVNTYLLEEKGAAGLLLHDISHYAPQLTDRNTAGEEIFTIVEEPASPVGGMNEFFGYIAKNMNYPASARQAGIEGKVFVEFVVYEDGSIHDVKLKKGIQADCDREAARVVAGAAPWNPGRQRGKAVKQRMVMPILFKLGQDQPASIIMEEPKAAASDFSVDVSSVKSGNRIKLTGTVKDAGGNPIAGMNIVIRGTTTGTVSGPDGKFQVESEQPGGALVFSFVGYKTQSVAF